MNSTMKWLKVALIISYIPYSYAGGIDMEALVIDDDGISMPGLEIDETGISMSGLVISNGGISIYESRNQRYNKSLVGKGADYSNADLTGVDFSGQNLSGANFSNADLENVNFRNAYLQNADFSNADLVRCDFRGAIVAGASFENVDFRGSYLGGVDFSWSDMTNSDIEGGNFRSPYVLTAANIGRVLMRENQSVSAVSLSIEFDSNKSSLRPAAMQQLEELALALNSSQLNQIVVRIEGHTDNVGKDQYNLTLSQQRSQAVVEALISVHGISSKRLSSMGYGETHPIATNNSSVGRSQNRRVTIVNLSAGS